MPFANPVGGVIVQTGGPDTPSALTGVTGVTFSDFGGLRVWEVDAGLAFDGTFSIDQNDGGPRELIIINRANAGLGVIGLHCRTGSNVTLGNRTAQGTDVLSSSRFVPCILEAQSHSFSQSRAKSDAGQPTLGPAAAKPFICVDGGATFVWNGCLDFTGGVGFDGPANTDSVPTVTTDANVEINNGVWDARRVTDRGGVGDNFLYNYAAAANVVCNSFTTISNEDPGLGVTLINLTEANFGSYSPINTELAFSGSTSSANDLDQVIEDYGGIPGNSAGVDMTSATNNAVNTNTIKWLNSSLGSQFAFNTQDPGVSLQTSVQTVVGQVTRALGGSVGDATIVTQDKNGLLYQANVSANSYDIGEILIAQWTPPGGATPPVREVFNPSNTDDDLWDLYLWAYTGEDRNRTNVLLRVRGGLSVDFTVPDDVAISEASRATVDAYTAIDDFSKLYDRQASYKVANVGQPSYDLPIARAVGQTVAFTEHDIRVDASAPAAWAYDDTPNPDLITINPSTAPSITFVDQAVAALLSEDTSIQIARPDGVADNDVMYLTVVHPEGDQNTWATPLGWSAVEAELLVAGSPTSPPAVTIYEKIAATEPLNYTVSGSFTSGAIASIVAYRGIDLANVQDAAHVTTAAATGAPNPSAITTVSDNSRVVVIGIGDGLQAAAAPASYALRSSVSTDIGGDDSGGAPTVAGPYVATTNPNDWSAAWIATGPGGAGFAAGNTNGQWSWDSDETPSTGVGPLTGNNDAGYIYTEMTSQSDGALWTLEFNTDIDASANAIDIAFSWSMRGADAQALINVQTNENGAGWVTRATTGFGDETIPTTGAGTAPWYGKAYDLAGVVSDATTRIRIQVVANTNPANAGNFWHNDVGVDDCTITITPLAGAGRGATLAVADRAVPTAGTETPPAFVFGGSGPNAAVTLALRLAPATGVNTNFGPSSSFDRVDTPGTVTIGGGATVDGSTFGGDVILEEVIDLTNVTILGTMFTEVAGVYTLTNSAVTSIQNLDAAGNAQINALGGSVVSTTEPGTGAGEVDIQSPVVISIAVTDESTNTPLPDARVFLRAASGGPIAEGTAIVGPVLVDASGQLTSIVNLTSDQPYEGLIAEAQAPGLFVPKPISGTISATSGLTLNISLVRDD